MAVDATMRIPGGARLDLGCGPLKQAGHIGIDLLDLPEVDVVGDVLEVLRSLPDGHVSAVYTSHFLEHIGDPVPILREVARVLAPGARATVIVPHFSNPYYYSDLTHRSPWGLYTLSYLLEGAPFKRHVPRYQEPIPLTLDAVRLTFKSTRPFYGRHAIKRSFGAIINRTRGLQEFYEENLVWLMPCYELRFELTA